MISRKQKKIIKTWELQDEEGNTVEILKIVVNPDAMMKDYNAAKNAMVALELEMKKSGTEPKPELLQKYGEAVMALIQLVVGEENAEKLLSHYREDEITELAEEGVKFIFQEIEPDLRKLSKERAERIKREMMKK